MKSKLSMVSRHVKRAWQQKKILSDVSKTIGIMARSPLQGRRKINDRMDRNSNRISDFDIAIYGNKERYQSSL